MSLTGAGGGWGGAGRGLTVAGGPPWPVFCHDLAVAVYLWVAPQPTGGCETIAADV